MFSRKNLYIPDYVTPEHIPIIISYFDYYNIAKVKKVEVFKHLEPEYYVENTNNYGFALIEIDTYYVNQGARNFYSAIENNKGLIVYDDPYSWEIMFSPFNEADDVSEAGYVSEEHDVSKAGYVSKAADVSEAGYVSKADDVSEAHDVSEAEEECYSSYEEEEKDDFDYNGYEKNFNCFKNKQNSKKQKITRELVDIKKSINEISTKQEKLLKILISNNKLKNSKNNSKNSNNQKAKDPSNTWTRRLRILF
jgi:hypothetical protein